MNEIKLLIDYLNDKIGRTFNPIIINTHKVLTFTIIPNKPYKYKDSQYDLGGLY